MAKVKAKWFFTDTDTLEDQSGNLALHLDSSGNIGSDPSGIQINVSENIDVTNNKSIEVEDATDPTDAINKSQLDAVAAQLNVWKEVVLDASQLVDTSSPAPSPKDGGIHAAQAVVIEPGKFLQAGDQLIITDGSSPVEVYEAGSTFDLDELILENLAAAINANSSLVTAVATNSLTSISGEYQTLILVEQTLGSEIRIYQNIVSSPAGNFQMLNKYDPALDFLYEGTSDHLIDVPSSDPGASPSQFGFSRGHDDLTNNETHLTRTQDAAYTWDHDAEEWDLFGSTSIPDATKSIKGKVQISDGIAVTSGIISVDLLLNEGLRLVGTTPNKKLAIDYDDSTIHTIQTGSPIGKLAVKLGGITNDELFNPEFDLDDENPGAPGSVALGGTLTLAAGEGINTSASGSTITVSFEDATSSNLGVFTINNSDFIPTSGAPELDDNVLKALTTDGSPGTVDPLSHTFGLDGDATQGVSVGVGSPSNEAAITVADATTSSKGVFQLDSNDFSVTGVIVSLLGSIPIQFNTNSGPAIPSAGVLDIIGGEGIDTNAPASPNATIEILPEDATDGNKGFFSLESSTLPVTAGAVDLCDCTTKTINADSGSATGLGHTITIAGDGGQGVSTSDPTLSPANDLEMTIQDASTAQKGVFQLNPFDFDVSASPPGIVTLDTTVLQSIITDSGTATPSSNNFNIIGGSGITTSGSGANLTIAANNATTTPGTKGVFSLQSDAGSPFDVDFVLDGNNHVTLHGSVPQSFVTDGTPATPSLSSLSIISGEGIDTSGASSTVTISFEDASYTNRGAAQYSSTSFSLVSGACSIKTDGIKDTHLDWGSGANQINASDFVLDTTSSPGLGYSPTINNTQDGLEALEVDIDNLEERQVDQFTLSSGDISNKYVVLSAMPMTITRTVLIVKDGVSQQYGDDFEIDSGSPQNLTWDGLGLDGLLETGDKITVVYAI